VHNALVAKKPKPRRAGKTSSSSSSRAKSSEPRAARADASADAPAGVPSVYARREPEVARSDARSPGASAPPAFTLHWVLGVIAAVITIIAITRMRAQEPATGARDPDRGDTAETPEHGRAASGDADPVPAAIEEEDPDAPPERLAIRIVRSHPHDPEAFTQGLLWHDGHLYESTGLYGESTLRKVDLESGEVRRSETVEERFFAEGLARVGAELYQLTWQEHRAIVWSLPDLRRLRTIEYEGEGWGLCHDGTHLVMSNGSDRLAFRDPSTFEIVRSVRVHERGRAVDELNELECVDGVVWANVWQTDRILRIDPRTGRVTGVVDARGLLDGDDAADADVLNGIAWIPERRRFVITGKLWPRAFEVDFVPATDAR
jgi:glutamine cyclotransferase